ncbi:hypothetical protein HHI36_020224 [Cryptolaemus montrouzieri]|uniref:Uncharacterized protein n=1 Tax=Cryptolaemus montrouzieri TaxID=559131 RepID=A0ABD2NAV2_9CUCU
MESKDSEKSIDTVGSTELIIEAAKVFSGKNEDYVPPYDEKTPAVQIVRNKELQKTNLVILQDLNVLEEIEKLETIKLKDIESINKVSNSSEKTVKGNKGTYKCSSPLVHNVRIKKSSVAKEMIKPGCSSKGLEVFDYNEDEISALDKFDRSSMVKANNTQNPIESNNDITINKSRDISEKEMLRDVLNKSGGSELQENRKNQRKIENYMIQRMKI